MNVYYLLVREWEFSLVQIPVERETKALFFVKPGKRCSLLTGATVYGLPTQLRKSDPNVFLAFDLAANAVRTILNDRIAYKEKELITLRADLARLAILTDGDDDPTISDQ